MFSSWWGRLLECDKPGILEFQFWITFLHFFSSSVNIQCFFSWDVTLAMIHRGWLRSGYRLMSTETTLCAGDQPQITFTCRRSLLGWATAPPWDPSVRTLKSLYEKTRPWLLLWPGLWSEQLSDLVFFYQLFGVADDIIYPCGVMVGARWDNGEGSITNSLVDHHHLSITISVCEQAAVRKAAPGGWQMLCVCLSLCLVPSTPCNIASPCLVFRRCCVVPGSRMG